MHSAINYLKIYLLEEANEILVVLKYNSLQQKVKKRDEKKKTEVKEINNWQCNHICCCSSQADILPIPV